MNLFDGENINITKIYHINQYKRSHADSFISEYGNFFHTHEFVFFLSGENDTTVGGIEIHDCPNSIRFMPKGQSTGKYIVHHLKDYSSCVDIYFDTDSPMPKRPLGLYNNDKIKDKVLKLADVWQKKEVGFYVDSMKLFYDIIGTLQKERYNYLSDNQKSICGKPMIIY